MLALLAPTSMRRPEERHELLAALCKAAVLPGRLVELYLHLRHRLVRLVQRRAVDAPVLRNEKYLLK